MAHLNLPCACLDERLAAEKLPVEHSYRTQPEMIGVRLCVPVASSSPTDCSASAGPLCAGKLTRWELNARCLFQLRNPANCQLNSSN